MTKKTHWTIEEAADAIGEQEGWHQGARDALREQMVQSVTDGYLDVRHPHTGLRYQPKIVRVFYEEVTPYDVNTWLDSVCGSSMLWQPEADESDEEA